jgi:ribonucleoside-diphosphate reductase alpha chain
VDNSSHTYWTQGCDVSNCGEIVLRNCQFCNLSEVIIRSEDNLEDILNKVRIATIIGTHQATLTNFRYLRSIWKKNTEEERLLGVSLTGIMDHEVFSGKAGDMVLEEWLTKMKEVAIETNKVLAEKLGINQSVGITTVKPSGTISQLCDTSSGIHPRYSEYYIRTVRSDNTDPLTKFMKDSGIPNEPDVTKPYNTTVFSFPIKSPENSVISTEINAIEMLELDLLYNRYWTEHNVSITVYVREHEWFAVGAWVYDHFDEINGISFLPYSDHSYQQAPYQPITKGNYEDWMKKMPVVDWTKFNVEELQDNTIGSQQYACSGSSCELL